MKVQVLSSTLDNQTKIVYDCLIVNAIMWKRHPIYNIQCSDKGEFIRLDKPSVKPRLFSWSTTKYHFRCRVAPNTDKQLHRLVYECFYSLIPDGLVVIHLDEYHPFPNSPDNLALSTDEINHIDKCSKNRQHRLKKEINPNSKLTINQINEIKKLKIQGMSYRNIAKIYNVSHPTIISIIKEKTWV